MDFNEVIQTRRSVRSFLSDPIPADILNAILESGRNAPSYQNRQCWRYIVLTNKERIIHLAKNCGFVGKINFFLKDAPVVMVACADPSKSGTMNGQNYYLVDTAISFHQMMLTAWSFGVGSCWMAAFNEKSVKKVLSIPENIKVIALSPFGYPKNKETFYGKAVKLFASSGSRQGMDQVVSYDSWKF